MGKIIGIIFGVVALFGVVGLGITFISGFFSTASSVVSAPSRVINKTLETNNIINNYNWFYDNNAAFIAKVGQIKVHANYLKDEADKNERFTLRTELSAMRQICRKLATKYNANSEKLTTSVFKGWSLPQTLSINSCEV